MREIVRSRLEGLGPVTVAQLAEPLPLDHAAIAQALDALQQEGFVLQGRFTPGGEDIEWCERGLLARIHRYTLKQLRSEIEPVAPADFMRFLFHWQGLDDPGEGEAALHRTLLQLEGISVPAGSWENDILPARLRSYVPSDLDALCSAGKIAWLRLRAPADDTSEKRKNPVIKTTKIAFIARPHLAHWQAYTPIPPIEILTLSGSARAVCTALREFGASFFEELLAHTGLLKSQLKDALGELAACGLVTSDSFHGLRTLITPQRVQRHRHRHRRLDDQHARAGRWSLLRPRGHSEERGHRSCRAHCPRAAAPLWRGVPKTAGAGERPAALARAALRLPPDGSTRRAARRSLRAGLRGRTVCIARGGKYPADDPQQAEARRFDRHQRRRSTESHRSHHAGTAGAAAADASPALSRRHTRRFRCQRRDYPVRQD